jgi:hypothetical protein
MQDRPTDTATNPIPLQEPRQGRWYAFGAGARARANSSYTAIFQRADQERVCEDLRDFFGPRADKYLAIYERMRASNKTHVNSWNWIVFFTTFPWFFYRKMYLAGAGLIFLPMLAAYLFGLTGNAGAMAGVSLIANGQYVLLGMRRLLKADALGLVGEERKEYLRRAGGVSVVAGVLTGLLAAAIFAMAILGAYLKHHKSAH